MWVAPNKLIVFQRHVSLQCRGECRRVYAAVLVIRQGENIVYNDSRRHPQIHSTIYICWKSLKDPNSSGTLERALVEFSNSVSSSVQSNPFVKSKPLPCFTENLSNCNARINSGLIWLLQAVIVSFADEKTRSHGTAEPWIGRISIASLKIVG